MKKINSFFVICLVGAISLTSCASAPKVKDISGPTEIIEHKGTAFGVAQPDWVGTVLATPNQKTLSKALGIDKHIWVVSKSGENLDFIKTWADQVDARAEIGASIKQGISDFVGAHADGDDSDIEETVKRYSARASTVMVSGLNKETDWWVLGRTRHQKKNEVESKYTYLVVYSMDEDLYQKQIKNAFKGEDEKVIDDLIRYLINYTMVEAKD
ncbi:MAG: hypothetical protein K6C97_01715 [Treponema sp.]|nr:hypothetical protein [Treponema sp.]